MKQLEDNKICKYCYGCNKLEEQDFEGVSSCKYFIQATELDNYYKTLRKDKKK